MKKLSALLLAASFVFIGTAAFGEDKADASKDKKVDDSSRKCTKRCVNYNDSGKCVEWACD
jgi:hypothetical protein